MPASAIDDYEASVDRPATIRALKNADPQVEPVSKSEHGTLEGGKMKRKLSKKDEEAVVRAAMLALCVWIRDEEARLRRKGRKK